MVCTPIGVPVAWAALYSLSTMLSVPVKSFGNRRYPSTAMRLPSLVLSQTASNPFNSPTVAGPELHAPNIKKTKLSTMILLKVIILAPSQGFNGNIQQKNMSRESSDSRCGSRHHRLHRFVRAITESRDHPHQSGSTLLLKVKPCQAVALGILGIALQFSANRQGVFEVLVTEPSSQIKLRRCL